MLTSFNRVHGMSTDHRTPYFTDGMCISILVAIVAIGVIFLVAWRVQHCYDHDPNSQSQGVISSYFDYQSVKSCQYLPRHRDGQKYCSYCFVASFYQPGTGGPVLRCTVLLPNVYIQLLTAIYLFCISVTLQCNTVEQSRVEQSSIRLKRLTPLSFSKSCHLNLSRLIFIVCALS